VLALDPVRAFSYRYWSFGTCHEKLRSDPSKKSAPTKSFDSLLAKCVDISCMLIYAHVITILIAIKFILYI
jgi:hypothetical protein